MKVRDCKRRAEEERVERIRQARELEEKRKAEDELKRRDERSIPAVPDAGTFAFLGMPGGTALKVISGLLMVQAIIRVGVIHYLWNAFQPGTTDVLVNGFAIGWLLLAAASFTIGFGIIRRRQWMRPLGITLSGVAVLNDAFFAFAGLWNAAVWWWHGDFLWFLVLGSSSALYLAVDILSLAYLWGWYRPARLNA